MTGPPVPAYGLVQGSVPFSNSVMIACVIRSQMS
jgi:hypothetical protein